MSFLVAAAVSRAGSVPHALGEWLGKIQARPAHRRARERGGPYSIAG